MKKIVRIYHNDLQKMIKDSLKERGLYIPEEKKEELPSMEHLPQEQMTPKFDLSLSEKEIIFLEDILSHVNHDDENEKKMLDCILHVLREKLAK